MLILEFYAIHSVMNKSLFITLNQDKMLLEALGGGGWEESFKC